MTAAVVAVATKRRLSISMGGERDRLNVNFFILIRVDAIGDGGGKAASCAPKCPVSEVKRTSGGRDSMSANDPLQTLGGAAKGEHGLHTVRTGTVIDPPQFRRCLDANLSHSRRKARRDRIKESRSAKVPPPHRSPRAKHTG